MVVRMLDAAPGVEGCLQSIKNELSPSATASADLQALCV